MFYDFGDTHDGDFIIVGDQSTPAACICGPPMPKICTSRRAFKAVARLRSVHVSGSFAGRKKNGNGRHRNGFVQSLAGKGVGNAGVPGAMISIAVVQFLLFVLQLV